MVRLSRVTVVAVVGLVACSLAPADAAIYTVTMKSGNSFESRYEPQDASWDKSKLVMLDEMGNQISISKDEIEKVESDFEAKGYGAMLDNTTMALGWAPNDAADPDAETAVGTSQDQPQGERPPITYNQFVEPSQTQGMPGEWVQYPTGQLGAGVNDNAGGGPYLSPGYAQPSPQAGSVAPESGGNGQ